jgi:ferredoxin
MVMSDSPKTNKEKLVKVFSEDCGGCGLCQLACSMSKTGVFNPAASRIKLNRVEGKERYAISFTDECNNCGMCAKYCYYGVLRGGQIDANSAYHSRDGVRWY